MALSGSELSKNINIRSKYVLTQKRHEPLFHQMLPYHAPPVFPKAPKLARRIPGTSLRPASEITGDEELDSYKSVYRNYPQQIDDEIDDMFLARPSSSRTAMAKSSSPCSDATSADYAPRVYENPHVDGALALAGDDHEYVIIRREPPKCPQLQQLNEQKRKCAAELKHREAVAACLSRRLYKDSADHFNYVDSRVQRCLDESNRQTAELFAATRVNTQRESEERDEHQKHIRHRLFLKSNSPFSAAQSVVVSRLEEKLYATSPIDLLAQKNRTRCQYSNLPVVRRMNELAIEAERDREQSRGLVFGSQVIAEANRRRRKELEKKAAMADVSKDLQRQIRGKSAHAIGAALYAESMKNIKSSRNVQEANEECVQKCKSSMRTSRALMRQTHARLGYDSDEEGQHQQSMTTYSSGGRGRSMNRTIHIDMVDDRALDNMNHNVMTSLEACRHQLANMSHTSTDMYAASR